MLRTVSGRLSQIVSTTLKTSAARSSVVMTIRHSHGPTETDEEFDARYEAFFNKQDIDGWEIRKAMNDLQGYDLVPEPKIIVAALKACRRIDDYALAVRYLEAVKEKCSDRVDTIWPFIKQELKPTLDELGVLTPEEMGYDKPELATKDVFDIHG